MPWAQVAHQRREGSLVVEGRLDGDLLGALGCHVNQVLDDPAAAKAGDVRGDDGAPDIGLRVVGDLPPSGEVGLDQRALHDILGVAEVTGQRVGEAHQGREPSRHERIEVTVRPAGHRHHLLD